MNTDLQPKKSSSPKRRLNKTQQTILKITANQWWPFDRVDGKLLQRLHKEQTSNQLGEALL